MKNCSISTHLAYASLLSILVFSIISCAEEQVRPVFSLPTIDHNLNFRGFDPTDRAESVKVNVAKRDNIPLIQILSSYYYGQTLDGFWEYRLTTMSSGNKTFILTGIIGEDNEGY